MGRLSPAEAAQILIAAQQHSNAILSKVEADDDTARSKAELELERKRNNLQVMVGRHVRGEPT